MATQKYCLTLDLIEDALLIAEYKAYHQNVWPEIIKSIKDSGIEVLDIYNVDNRLVMIIETNEKFSFDEKSKADTNSPKVQEWENLMWKFQLALPWAKSIEKWMLRKKIFELQ